MIYRFFGGVVFLSLFWGIAFADVEIKSKDNPEVLVFVSKINEYYLDIPVELKPGTILKDGQYQLIIKSIKPGDINKNGKVDLADVIRILQIMGGME